MEERVECMEEREIDSYRKKLEEDRGMSSGQVIDIYNKFANLFRIIITPPIDYLYLIPQELLSQYPTAWKEDDQNACTINGDNGLQKVTPDAKILKNYVRNLLCQKLEGIQGLRLNSFKTKIYSEKPLKEYGTKTNRLIKIYPGCKFRVMSYGDELFLCLDFCIAVKNKLNIEELFRLIPTIKPRNVTRLYYCDDAGKFEVVSIKSIGIDTSEILKDNQQLTVPSNKLIPDLEVEIILDILSIHGIRHLFNRDLKEISLLTVNNPSRQRLQKTCELLSGIKKSIFPIHIGKYTIDVEPEPTRLMPPLFVVKNDLQEPASTFDHEDSSKISLIILDGLSTFGSYEKPKVPINLVLLSTKNYLPKLRDTIDALITGSGKFKGVNQTFGVNLQILKSIATNDFNEYQAECLKFVKSDQYEKTNVFLVYTPKSIGLGYDSPYFDVKKFLLQNGIPSQMIDTATLNNPKFRDFNLALNIFAKAGYVPWVLNHELRDVDLFVGLSYSSIKREDNKIDRMMGYVNIFDNYGRWRFYQGDAQSFKYEERFKKISNLVASSIAKYKALNQNRNIETIEIHFTQKYSKRFKEIIYKEICRFIPGCKVVFVHLNIHHPIRLYDLDNPEGALSRGNYVITGDDQFLMSTTGPNVVGQKGMGTPQIIQVNVQCMPDEKILDLSNIAEHIFDLTKLNWASTRSFCHEPITTKFAGDISYLMDVFMTDDSFSVNERVKSKPWFL